MNGWILIVVIGVGGGCGSHYCVAYYGDHGRVVEDLILYYALLRWLEC